jgi:hypothetical protein
MDSWYERRGREATAAKEGAEAIRLLRAAFADWAAGLKPDPLTGGPVAWADPPDGATEAGSRVSILTVQAPAAEFRLVADAGGWQISIDTDCAQFENAGIVSVNQDGGASSFGVLGGTYPTRTSVPSGTLFYALVNDALALKDTGSF